MESGLVDVCLVHTPIHNLPFYSPNFIGYIHMQMRARSYTLQASMSGYVTNTGTANVAAGSIVTSSITLQAQSTGGTPSGGVPGYTYEEISAGIVLAVVLLVWLRRRV